MEENKNEVEEIRFWRRDTDKYIIEINAEGMAKEQNKSWEERFSSEFEIIAKTNGFRTGCLKSDIPFEKIKDFISTEISLARQQERENLIEEVKTLKGPKVPRFSHNLIEKFRKKIINLIKDKS